MHGPNPDRRPTLFGASYRYAPPDLHRRLRLRAAEANVSLNRIVNDQLDKG